MEHVDKIASSLANILVDLWAHIGWIFKIENFQTRPLMILDIILVAVVFYWIYLFLKKTSASRYLPGFLFISFLAGLGLVFDLTVISWLFSKLFLVVVVAIPVIFQPEIR